VIETGLIIAQVVFLVLLYAFVWSVVRSSGKGIGPAAPPPPPPPAPRAREPRRARAPVAVATPAAADVAHAPRAPLPEPPAPAPEPATEARGDSGRAARGEGGGRWADERLDLAANIRPKLVVERSPSLPVGQEIPLDGGLTIGRSGSSGMAIEDPYVSHMHARVVRRGPFLFVEDLGSTNGTYLNDRRVERDAQLKVRDTLRIGETVLRYEE
jgi:FHA domain